MTRARSILVLCGAAAAVLLAAAALAGPGRDTRTDTSTVVGDAEHAIHGPQPATASAPEAAEQALAAMFTWQPVTDTSPGAALPRARSWLAGDLARAADSPPAPGVRELPEWAVWRRSGDIVTAHADAEIANDCDWQHCTIVATVTQTVLHRDGTSTPYRDMRIHARTQHNTEGWRVTGYRVVG
ncbi:hypothetical protein IU459_33610 [Nocardia amamiensis]|uniref:Secreted protein n=1 Tax=Nocardia amamiensis TaxID=404578 RepID=A0ABS0D1A4_9NOCA|nr:hypothetical protein [Nocardia amamiensis]MBF6302441.1 hypothetical protein [Nocardia amamiensis]